MSDGDGNIGGESAAAFYDPPSE
eukprot:SAG11_NODE_11123_length_782_cov_1.740849_1_plen_22_part_01